MATYAEMWQTPGQPDQTAILKMCAGCGEYTRVYDIDYYPTPQGVYEINTCGAACKAQADEKIKELTRGR